MSKKNNMISIIFSFKNESENILELIDRTVATMNKINSNYEIIFVDDHSTDYSKKLILDLSSKNKKIKYILMSRTFGTAPCVLAGMHHSKGEYLVYLDSDLQDPPEIIEKMYNEMLDGFEVVHTKRKVRKGENFFKLFLTKIAYFLLNKTLNIKLQKNSGDFKMITKNVAKKILDLKEKNPFLRGLPSFVGAKETVVFYERHKRKKGESKFPLLSSANPYKEFFRAITSFSSFPIYLILLSGLAMFFIFFVFIFNSLLSNNIDENYLVLIILFLFSVTQTSLGFIGLYIERLLTNTSNRPEYIISEKIGFE